MYFGEMKPDTYVHSITVDYLDLFNQQLGTLCITSDSTKIRRPHQHQRQTSQICITEILNLIQLEPDANPERDRYQIGKWDPVNYLLENLICPIWEPCLDFFSSKCTQGYGRDYHKSWDPNIQYVTIYMYTHWNELRKQCYRVCVRHRPTVSWRGLKGHWHENFSMLFLSNKTRPQTPWFIPKAVSNINSNLPI